MGTWRKATVLSRPHTVAPAVERKGLKKREWAYLAGFIDGEGCISAQDRSHRRGKKSHVPLWCPRVVVSQKNPVPLQWIADTFACGELRLHERRYTTGRGEWTISKWRAQRLADVKWVLEGILPYLILKKTQAEVAINMCQRPITKGELADMAQLLKELK